VPEYISWTPMIIAIIVLGLVPNLLFKIIDPAVVKTTLSAFGA
jgi:NADH:ubiquinone oxidoreductase subunit 4 (subunit M)